MSVDGAMLKIKRFGFPVTLAVLFVATADGFAALLDAHFLWNPLGWGFAIALAAVVDFILVQTLVEWLKTRGIAALAVMLVFMGVSGAASINFWYRQIRGSEKTIELFELQRGGVVSGLITVRDRLEEARNGLASLAAHSNQMAEREVKGGDTCERQTAKTHGPRQRFRASDAMFFDGLQKDLVPIPPRLAAEIDAVRALKPEPGPTLIEAANRLRLAAANAGSVVNDPALGRIATELRKRIDEDLKPRVDGKTTYNCADATVRTLAGTAVARLEKLPKLPPIVVDDWSKPGGGLGILPLIVNVRTWGTPGGLSGVDAIVVALAVLVELALFWTARGYARVIPPDRVLPNLPAITEGMTDEVLVFVRYLSQDPDPEVRKLAEIIDRYRARILFLDMIIVSLGCNDPRAKELAWRAPIFTRVGWARRVRWVPNLVINTLGWWHWKETRGCEQREAYRLDLAAIDELRLAEVVSRMRGAAGAAEHADAGAGEAEPGPERRRHLTIVP